MRWVNRKTAVDAAVAAAFVAFALAAHAASAEQTEVLTVNQKNIEARNTSVRGGNVIQPVPEKSANNNTMFWCVDLRQFIPIPAADRERGWNNL